MNTTATIATPAVEVRERIATLLEELPSDSLIVVERFVQFLNEQAKQGEAIVTARVEEEAPPYQYPTVLLPASALEGLENLLPEGYEGDALADSEALYKEV